jgi:4-aminobutyrate aminotransferase-like enzyme
VLCAHVEPRQAAACHSQPRVLPSYVHPLLVFLCAFHSPPPASSQVQSGAARTGSWWGHQQFDNGDMQPDLMIFAKGIASGYPLAGVVGRVDSFDHLAPGSMVGARGEEGEVL